MKTEEHDGEDDSAVLVNITASHSKYSVRRFRRRKCWKRKLNRLIVTWSMISYMSVLKIERYCYTCVLQWFSGRIWNTGCCAGWFHNKILRLDGCWSHKINILSYFSLRCWQYNGSNVREWFPTSLWCLLVLGVLYPLDFPLKLFWLRRGSRFSTSCSSICFAISRRFSSINLFIASNLFFLNWILLSVYPTQAYSTIAPNTMKKQTKR